MPIDWTDVKNDIRNAASGLKSAIHLVKIGCGVRKTSTWVMVAECGICATNIVYRSCVVFKHGGIVEHTHNLAEVFCRGCRKPPVLEKLRHKHVDRHEA